MIRLRRAWTPPNCCGTGQTFWDRICELRISEGGTLAPKSRRGTRSMGVKQPSYGLRGAAEILEAFKGKVSISRSEEHTSELQSHVNLVCRLLLEKKKDKDE